MLRTIHELEHINFSDTLEQSIANALNDAYIDFIHESENPHQGLDFYLPEYDVFLEVKKFHSDRISRQMASRDNVIAVQGVKAVNFLISILKP